MKFAHIADCHLGAWRVPSLQEFSLKAFENCINKCIAEKVNFVLITGDLFDTAMPSIDVLKFATSKIRELKDLGIGCYVIAGSHDFSISGKTFLDVLENAGLLKNVGRYQEDENKVELKICNENNLLLAGFPGKKAGLEQDLIRKIQNPLLNDSFKILALHTTITESKPQGMEFARSLSTEEIPKGFDYYALGHLHKKSQGKINGGIYVYPGSLFPTSFDEFEKNKHGSFCIVNVDNNNIEVKNEDVIVRDVESLKIDGTQKTPEQIFEEASSKIKEIKNKIITLRIEGELLRGKTSDLNFSKLFEIVRENHCILLKNVLKLKSPEFKVEIESEGKDIDEIEKEVIEKYIQKLENKEFSDSIQNLIHTLDLEKQEGETNPVFENRINEGALKIFNIK